MHELVEGARAAIESSRRRIDDLNVYPVPDGDTGTNLTLTVRAIDEALQKDGADDRAGLAREVSRAALMVARGTPGRPAQIVRGATESLAESDDLARAFRSASDAAYRAVKKPVEGTMLTAIRSMADAAEHGADLAGIIARGDDTVAQTRELLPVLKEAGVVDAGAAGLVEIVRGIQAALTGEALAPPPEIDESFGLEAIHQELSRYRYCTVFVVEGTGSTPTSSNPSSIGSATRCSSSATAAPSRCTCTGRPRPRALARDRPRCDRGCRDRQHARSDPAARGTAAPSRSRRPDGLGGRRRLGGRGNRTLFESFGAIVVDGGPAMNPSTADLLAAIEYAPGLEVVVLSNNGNVILAAEHAVEHASKTARVIPTRSLQAGLAAVVAFDSSQAAAENLAHAGGGRRGRHRCGDDRLA